jgi:hypothetical protein
MNGRGLYGPLLGHASLLPGRGDGERKEAATRAPTALESIARHIPKVLKGDTPSEHLRWREADFRLKLIADAAKAGRWKRAWTVTIGTAG